MIILKRKTKISNASFSKVDLLILLELTLGMTIQTLIINYHYTFRHFLFYFTVFQ